MIDTKALRQKILDLAIKGELVPQDPTDEPAAVLLEKIRAEKQRLIKEGKIKKDKVDSVIFKCDDNRHYEKMKKYKPYNWEIVRLDEVLYYEQPTNYIVSSTDYKDTYPTPVLTAGKSFIIGCTNEKDGIYTDLPCIIFDDFTTESKYVNFPFKVKSSAMKILTNNSNTNLKYLFFVIQTIDRISDLHKRFWISDYSNKFIFLPPLAEQQRIVERVEELFAQIDIIEQNQTGIETLYDELKKCTLDLAIQGKLVPQDENDEPASELLKRIRAEKKAKLGKKYIDSYIYKGDDNCYYEKVGSEIKNITEDILFDIPETWEWIRLGTLFQHNTGKTLNSSNTKGVKRKYITTSNLYWNGFKLDNLREMLFTDEEMIKCSVKKGDLLVCEGGDIGRAAIWNYDYSMCIQNHIHKLRPYIQINIEFYYNVFYVYKTSGFIGGKGIGIQGISSNALDKLLLPLPSSKEQDRICERWKTIFAKIKDED